MWKISKENFFFSYLHLEYWKFQREFSLHSDRIVRQVNLIRTNYRFFTLETYEQLCTTPPLTTGTNARNVLNLIGSNLQLWEDSFYRFIYPSTNRSETRKTCFDSHSITLLNNFFQMLFTRQINGTERRIFSISRLAHATFYVGMNECFATARRLRTFSFWPSCESSYLRCWEISRLAEKLFPWFHSPLFLSPTHFLSFSFSHSLRTFPVSIIFHPNFSSSTFTLDVVSVNILQHHLKSFQTVQQSIVRWKASVRLSRSCVLFSWLTNVTNTQIYCSHVRAREDELKVSLIFFLRFLVNFPYKF